MLNVWSPVVLVHRLPMEETTPCSPMADLLPYTIDQISQVQAKPVACALASADLIGIACLAWMLDPPSMSYADRLASAGRIGAAMALWLLVGYSIGLYRAAALRRLAVPVWAAMLAECLACWPLLLTAAVRAGSSPTAWRVPGLCASAMALWIVITRLLWAGALRALLRRGFCLDRVLVLAGSLSAARVTAAELEQSAGGSLRAVVSLPMPGCAGGVTLPWIAHTIRTTGIGKVFVAEGADGRAATNAVAFELAGICNDVIVLPRAGASYRIAAPAPEALRWAKPSSGPSGPQAALKRLCDVVIALLALLLGGPAMLLIALAIKADSTGPVLFHQERWGIRNSIFRIRKFRTMYHHLEDRECAVQTAKHDSRVTCVGRFLRKTSFDELPQLLNVLTGEMSIVGPRPHAIGMKVAGSAPQALTDDYDARHSVKPGITGWAQVNGCRGELNTKRALWRRIALDSYYIRNWSLRLDAVIILRTAATMVMDRHAY